MRSRQGSILELCAPGLDIKLPNVAEVEIITSNFISSYYFAGLYFLRDEFQLCGQFSFISDESLFIELIAYFICTSGRFGIVVFSRMNMQKGSLGWLFACLYVWLPTNQGIFSF
jgi:hypothetical protein